VRKERKREREMHNCRYLNTHLSRRTSSSRTLPDFEKAKVLVGTTSLLRLFSFSFASFLSLSSLIDKISSQKDCERLVVEKLQYEVSHFIPPWFWFDRMCRRRAMGH